jgi:hypothetical protein
MYDILTALVFWEFWADSVCRPTICVGPLSVSANCVDPLLGPVQADFSSVNFRAVFWPLGTPDTIWLKPNSGLAEMGIGPDFELAANTLGMPFSAPGSTGIQATENPEHGKQAC